MKPALPSNPPPPNEGAQPRPMSPFVATLWAIGCSLSALWLLQLTAWTREPGEGDVVTALACQAISVLGCLFLILRVHAPEASIREVVALRSTHAAFYPLGISLGVAVTLPASVLYSAILRRWPDQAGDDVLAKALTEGGTARRVLVALAFVLLAPALEEAFYRGALFTPQRRRTDSVTVVVVTAVLFSMAHLTPQRFLPILLVGLGMGVLRASSGSLVPSVLMHATFNALPVYSMFTAGARPEDANEPLPWALAAASAGVAIALVASAHLLGARSEVAARARERDTS